MAPRSSGISPRSDAIQPGEPGASATGGSRTSPVADAPGSPGRLEMFGYLRSLTLPARQVRPCGAAGRQITQCRSGSSPSRFPWTVNVMPLSARAASASSGTICSPPFKTLPENHFARESPEQKTHRLLLCLAVGKCDYDHDGHPCGERDVLNLTARSMNANVRRSSNMHPVTWRAGSVSDRRKSKNSGR
jgi:hypothetical protein